MHEHASKTSPLARLLIAGLIFAAILAVLGYGAMGVLRKGGRLLGGREGLAFERNTNQLFYKSIGKSAAVTQPAKPLPRNPNLNSLDKSFTLEIENAASAELAEQSLRRLAQLKIRAFGVFRSKASAEAALAKLQKEQQINATVSRLR
jgi:hypothetical protein